MTRLTDKKPLLTLIVFILMLFIVMMLSSCGVNYHLRMAKKKGADFMVDTTWHTIPLITPEIKFETTLKPVNVKDTLIARDASGAVTKVFIHQRDTVIDSVFIQTTCPPDTVYKKVPVSVHNQIKSPHGFWYYLFRLALPCLIVGFIVGVMFWPSLKMWIKGML